MLRRNNMKTLEYYLNYVMYKLGELGMCLEGVQEIGIANKRVRQVTRGLIDEVIGKYGDSTEVDEYIANALDENITLFAKTIQADIDTANNSNDKLVEEQSENDSESSNSCTYNEYTNSCDDWCKGHHSLRKRPL